MTYWAHFGKNGHLLAAAFGRTVTHILKATTTNFLPLSLFFFAFQFTSNSSLAVWPDLAKFRHFGNNFKVFGHFKKLCIVFGKLLNLLWQMFIAIGQIFIVVNCQKTKHNVATWSHYEPLVPLESPQKQGMQKAYFACFSFLHTTCYFPLNLSLPPPLPSFAFLTFSSAKFVLSNSFYF